MTTFSFTPLFRSRKHSLAQHAPPWSPSLWIAALVLCTLDHIFCWSLHNQNTLGTTPSYAAAVQHLLAVFVQLCLMASNTVVIFYIIYMLVTRRPRPEFFGASYLCPILTLFLLTIINIALAAVSLIIPAALVTVTAPGEHALSHYHYAPSLLLLTYGVALTLVMLSISAGSMLLWWGYEQRTPKSGAVLLPQDDGLYDLTRPSSSLDLDK